jgi:hypothetical protein
VQLGAGVVEARSKTSTPSTRSGASGHLAVDDVQQFVVGAL